MRRNTHNLTSKVSEAIKEHEKQYQSYIVVETINGIRQKFTKELIDYYISDTTINVKYKNVDGCICYVNYPLCNVAYYGTGEFKK